MASTSLCSVAAALCLLLAAPTTLAWPALRTTATVNLGTPLVVHYDLTDGLDGRLNAAHATPDPDRDGVDPNEYGTAIRPNVSPSGNDWIGLFPAEGCPTSVDNNQERHDCHIAWKYVAANTATGSVIFEAHEYKTAGEYQVRYFYGDDPTIPGNYNWLRQGWVCNSYDPSTDAFTQREGMAGTPEVMGARNAAGTKIQLEASQCQCNPDSTTQTITYQSCTENPVSDAGVFITQENCVSSCSHTGDNNEELDQTACTGTTWNGSPRTWTVRSWGNTAIDQDTCLGYRAACSRCFRDPVALSGTITVTGSSGVDNYQDMSGIPGFEIGFP